MGYAASQSSIIIKTGSFTLDNETQVITTPTVTFDTTSSGVYALEYERTMNNNMSWGVEYITYDNDFSGPAGDATSTHLALNFRKYFDVAKRVQPFFGAGISAASVSLGGANYGGSGSGFGFQAMGGVKFPFDSVAIVLEYKIISAEPDDDAGSSVDTSGNGLFAGLAINF